MNTDINTNDVVNSRDSKSSSCASSQNSRGSQSKRKKSSRTEIKTDESIKNIPQILHQEVIDDNDCNNTSFNKPTPIPNNLINLRLILIDGNKRDFLFSPIHTANYVTEHVYQEWDAARKLEGVNSAKFLKLIYQGRFLHGNVILGALLLPLGKTSVMHLVVRETLPEPNTQDEKKKKRTGFWSRHTSSLSNRSSAHPSNGSTPHSNGRLNSPLLHSSLQACFHSFLCCCPCISASSS